MKIHVIHMGLINKTANIETISRIPVIFNVKIQSYLI